MVIFMATAAFGADANLRVANIDQKSPRPGATPAGVTPQVTEKYEYYDIMRADGNGLAAANEPERH